MTTPFHRVIGLAVLLGQFALCIAASNVAPAEAMRLAVEEDWSRQEVRLGRTDDSGAALSGALERAERIHAREGSRLPPALQETWQASWPRLKEEAAAATTLDGDLRRQIYRRVRWLARAIALQSEGIAGRPLLFMTRNRYVCQMLHEYMGYFYDYGDVSPGGSVRVLDHPGQSMDTRDLIQGRLSGGNFTTLALSHDGRSIYFAFAARGKDKPKYGSPDRRSFHIYRMNADGSALHQLTSGVEDDFDPCPLPDGGVAFMSSRRGGFARCNNAWEPCASYTLHRMDADGSNIRTLSAHETSEWHPSVMNDGRLVYIRWDYVDRSAANFHGLWASNPDGTGVTSLFGNYTMRINACYQPRAIPGSDKLVFIAGAHHADVGGSLVLLDPRRARLDAESGEDTFDPIERLTPEVCFPESEGWPKSYFHSPWPLSEEVFLVSFSFDTLPGMSSGESKDTHTGLYYFDRLGNLELIYRDPAISSMYPIPLKARHAPPALASGCDPVLGDEGELMVGDVTRSLFPMPAERPVKELRVFQVLPKGGDHTANEPRIGHANAESVRMLLGSVPVEADGSAYFRVPARKPIYFQAVDAEGRALQSMRSVTYLQPGERRSCVGCHEPPGSAPSAEATLAMRRGPSTLAPGPDGSKPLSYTRLVQPVLDRHCVRCHDGSSGDGKSKLALTGGPAKPFTRSYSNLKPFLRWYEWGGASISQIATHPGHIGADESPLSRILADPTHVAIGLPDEDRRRFYLWLDANVPFFGTYDRDEQLAQREGRAIKVPAFQ